MLLLVSVFVCLLNGDACFVSFFFFCFYFIFCTYPLAAAADVVAVVVNL